VDNSAGLFFAYLSGTLRKNNKVFLFLTSSLELPSSSTLYIEVDHDGVSFTIGGFTLGKLPLYKVTTDASSITSIEDNRTWLKLDSFEEGETQKISASTFNIEKRITTYLADTSANHVDLILPIASLMKNITLTFRHVDGTYAMTVYRSGDSKIEFNGNEYVEAMSDNIGTWFSLKSDGTNYHVVMDSGLTELNFAVI
jgi:hypothetical protein